MLSTMRASTVSSLRQFRPAVNNLRSFSTTPKAQDKKVVFVQGARTPFCVANTDYEDYMAHDLQREAIKGLMKKSGLKGSDIEYVCAGYVIQDVLTSNVAREAAMGAGLPLSVPAHTVTLACIGANVATATLVDKIKVGQIECGIAGGVELMSDLPIRYSRPLRKRLLKVGKMKTTQQKLGLLKGLTSADFMPQPPAVAEFSTGEVMGCSADRLCAAFNVSRADQDLYAKRSHEAAAAATKAGFFTEELVPIQSTTTGKFVMEDNGIRPASLEQLAKLKPAFIKPHGTVSAATSSFLTDGASASLIMSEDKCYQHGLTPRGILLDYVFVSQDPKEQLLLGPSYATKKLLMKNNMQMSDIGVWEFHEAFAGQVLANINAMNSDAFCKKNMGMDKKLGELPMEKLNTRGGSLSVGHPFGATGTRLLTWACDRLKYEDQKYAVITACAAGGQGVAMLVERHPDF